MGKCVNIISVSPHISFKMICPTLEDNPCGDFGIDLDFSSGESEQICRERQLHSNAAISQKDSAGIKLWFSRGSNYRVS